MPDVHTPKQRSFNMSRIRGRDTKPEMLVRSELHRRGYRYRLHDRRLPGRPDLVLPKWRTVVFVNGCFWHRHEGCRYASRPKGNAEFWSAKLNRNMERDRESYQRLRKAGWRVLVVWECGLKKKNIGVEQPIRKIEHWLNGRRMFGNLPRRPPELAGC